MPIAKGIEMNKSKTVMQQRHISLNPLANKRDRLLYRDYLKKNGFFDNMFKDNPHERKQMWDIFEESKINTFTYLSLLLKIKLWQFLMLVKLIK